MNPRLVVLVPDKNIEQTVHGLLERHRSIGMQELKGRYSIVVHPNRDPGVYNSSAGLLESYVETGRYALIIFDRAWDGAPLKSAVELAEDVEDRCHSAWGDHVRCVCIDPEIESWIWSDSPHVARELGWASHKELGLWLADCGLWPEGRNKPPDPKRAFEEATKQKRVVPSSAIFGSLARKVSLRRCQDKSFITLLEILRSWFPAEAE